MSEMKMSDYFRLPIDGGDVMRINEYCMVKENNDVMAPFDAAEHAINNHDSLVEEVERLRGERDEAARYLTQLHNHLSESERLYKGGALRQEIAFLLAKIKGEDNE